MEALAALFGLLLLLALGLALIGVPLLLRRVGQLSHRLQTLETNLTRLAHATTVDKPAESTPPVSQPTHQEPVEEPRSTPPSYESAVIEALSGGETSETEGWASSRTVEKPVSAADSVDIYVAVKDEKAAWWQPLLDRLLAMNVTAQVGAVVLIFGAIFLGKYASDIGVLTLQAKLILMATASVVFAGGGSYLYQRQPLYAQIMQGVGFAGWLVTLFVAHVLYQQIPWLVTLIAGVFAVVLIGYRAIRQDSQWLAMLAFLGGFMTPFIASSEVSSLWRLFAFLGVLNVAVVGTALSKPWRWLVREAYVGSFGLLAALMLAEHLQNDLNQASTQWPMLSFIAVTLMAFSILAWRWLATQQLVFIRHASGLLFGVPAAATLALQALFHESAGTVAWCLGLAGLWYAGLFLVSRQKTLLAIAVVLATGAVPYALSDNLTSLTYAIEGAAFVYWAVRFNRRVGFVWGCLLQLVAAAFAFHLFLETEIRADHLSVSWLLYGAITLAGLSSAVWLRRYQQPFAELQRYLQGALLVWSVSIWLYQWAFWLSELYSMQYTLWYLTWVVAGTLGAVFAAAIVWRWRLLRQGLPLLQLLFAVLGMYFLAEYAEVASGLKLWVLAALSVGLFVIRGYQAKSDHGLADWDALIVWFVLPALTALSLFHAPVIQTDWNLIWLMAFPLVIAFYLQRGLALFFQAGKVRRFSRVLSLMIVGALSLATLSRLGNYSPLPFWPLLHPLLLAAIFCAEILYRFIRRHRVLRLVWVMWLGAVLTIELNRWLFHYAGVAFNLDAWLSSALTQTVWSLVWTLIGGLLMITGARLKPSRSRWMLGASVLGIIVLKMFVLDLAQAGTLYRILSFIGVGGLLLAIGFIAPIPDTAQGTRQDVGDAQNTAP